MASVAPAPQNQQPMSSESPPIRYPPFPSVPPDVGILPYAQFKEVGIRINGVLPPKGDGGGENSEDDGTEVDGLGVPTVSLRIRHETDVCKTLTKGRKVKLENRKEKEKDKEKEGIKKDPIIRSLEQRQKRITMFANKEWYDQWEEGEALRGMKGYDSDISIIDRIHSASSEFRSGRTWPPASSGLGYLWDQFRIYTGLLGQPPVWYRTDLQQSPDDAVEDNDEDDEELLAKPPQVSSTTSQAPLNRRQEGSRSATVNSDDDDDDEGVGDDPDRRDSALPSTNAQFHGDSQQPQKRKRIPVRTPYALHDIVPLPLSSQSQVKALLHLASLCKHQKLLDFLSSPDTSLRVFFSWYLYHQGFVYSPSYLANLPRLVRFFMEFLLRTKAVPESERALKRAVEIAKRATTEVPAAGRLCRLLPDKMGSGCVALWGKRWVEDEGVTFGELLGEKKREEEGKKDAMRKFEEELKKENVQVVSAENVVPSTHKEAEKDEDNAMTHVAISVEIVPSELFRTVEENLTPTARIEEVVETAGPEDETNALINQSDQGPLAGGDDPNSSPATSEVRPPAEPPVRTAAEPTIATDEQSIPWHWDTTSDTKPEPTPAQQKKALLDTWAPNSKSTQPLMALFGMTVLPLKYEPGVVERSMRRVRAIIGAGEKASEERRWRGVQEELVQRLARIVLEPWLDWDDGGLAGQYRSPSVQVRPKERRDNEEGIETKEGPEERVEKRNDDCDASKNVITVLVEPRVAEQLSIGMGLAGTWVQIVRVAGNRREGGGSGGGKDERANHRGWGRGRGRGGWRGRDITDVSAKNAEIESGAEPSRALTAEHEPNQKAEEETSTDSKRYTVADADAPPRGGRGRGRGRGRGGNQHHRSGVPETEFTFWYVEYIHMAVPSFWMAGEEEEPLKLPDDAEEQDNELPDEFED